MSTHSNGALYDGWRTREDGLDRLHAELAQEQVITIDLADYQPGQPHYEWLVAHMAEAQRWHWPAQWTVNL